eukprot:12675893-Heterocapsa_arctica.AAC.1
MTRDKGIGVMSQHRSDSFVIDCLTSGKAHVVDGMVQHSLAQRQTPVPAHRQHAQTVGEKGISRY